MDPAFPGSAAVLPERLRFLAHHELHRAKRWRGPGYGRTLLEAMISEGLADRFAVESLAAAPPPWSEAFARSQTPVFLQQASHAGATAAQLVNTPAGSFRPAPPGGP